MAKPAIRVYADTSVYGGCFDHEFAQASRAFFDQVDEGRFVLVISAHLKEELAAAPSRVQSLFASFEPKAQMIDLAPQALQLRAAYLEAGIVGQRWSADALHVALATTGACTTIVSWNFAHIVHFNKVPLYNAVNELRGFGKIAILSPPEVLGYEDENEEV
jgi:predicted nucleic acid-binding protein